MNMTLKNMIIGALRCEQTRAMIRLMSDTRSQLERFNDVWADAQDNVPFYAEWARRHKLPRQIADLKELVSWPILEKQDLICCAEKLIRKDVAHFHRSVTGGSTGEPLHFRTMPGEELPGFVNLTLGRARMNVYPEARMFLLWGHRHFYGQGWRSDVRFKIRQLKDWLVNHYRADATDLSVAALRKDYAKMIRFRPECIIAYSASLLALVRTIRKDLMSGYSEPVVIKSLRSVICTAGPLTKSEREEISSFFAVPVGMEYGSMECGVMAYMTPKTDSKYRVFDESHILHAVQETDEDARQIIVTTISKRYLPLIRYRIGDYMSGENVRDNGTVLTFSEVSGRTGDMIDLGNGARFHGYALMVCAEEIPKIVAYQLRVRRAEHKVLFVAQTTNHLTDCEKKQIIKHAADVAHIPEECINVTESTSLEKVPSGKIKLVIFE